MEFALNERLRAGQNVAIDVIEQVEADEQQKRSKSGMDAGFSVGSLTMTSENYYNGLGNGTYAYLKDYGGYGAGDSGSGVGGIGGNAAFLSAGPVSLDSAGLDVEAGTGGYSEEATGGNGGNALLSVNSNLTLTSNNTYSVLFVYGGVGGSNYASAPGVGGNGGAATLLVSGAVSIDSVYDEVNIVGGRANYGYGSAGMTEGSGGDAFASLGSLTLTSNNHYNGNGNGYYTYFEVSGGSGGWDYSYGNSGNGGNAALLTSGPVSADSSYFNLSGGSGGYAYYGGNGGNGGNSWMSIGGSLDVTSTYADSYFYVSGGNSGYVYNYSGGNGVGGNSGNAGLAVTGPVSVDSSYFEVEAGNAYGGNGTAGVTEGLGGSAWVSVGSLTLTSNNYYNGKGYGQYTDFYVFGESGGSDSNLAAVCNGGGATLLSAGAVSMDSSQIYVESGSGGSSNGANGGNGGNALVVLVGGLNASSTYTTSNFTVMGGNGGSNNNGGPGLGGNGGDASLAVAGTGQLDSSSINVRGGNGLYGFGNAGTTEGSGGNALASFGSLILTSDNYNANFTGTTGNLNVNGGSGAYDNTNGVGGNGGLASLTSAGPVSVDSSAVSIAGGNAGPYGYGQSGATEGSGGSAWVSMGNLTLTSNAYNTYGNSNYSYLNIVGGTGGGDYSLAAGGNGGDGILTATGAVSLDYSSINIYGGSGGFSTSANGGNGGNAVLTAGSIALNNSSEIDLYGGSGGIWKHKRKRRQRPGFHRQLKPGGLQLQPLCFQLFQYLRWRCCCHPGFADRRRNPLCLG